MATPGGQIVPYGGQFINVGQVGNAASALSRIKNFGGKLLRGTAAYQAADAIKPYTTDPAGKFLADHLVQGTLNVLGANPEQKRAAAGLPNVKSLGGVDYNVNSPEGKKGYAAATAEVAARKADRQKNEAVPDGSVMATVVDRDTSFDEGVKELDAVKEQDGPPPRIDAPARVTPAPDGSGATGTNTGYKIDLSIMDQMLARQNVGKMADVNSFTSTALPTTDSGSEQSARLSTGSVGEADSVVEGISNTGKVEASSVETADNNRALSVPGDTREGSGRNWMEARQQSWGEARKAAFLDPNLNSMQAYRAANAAVGIQHQGDKYFANDGGDLREINKDTFDAARRGPVDAETFKSGYVGAVKDTLVPAAQNDITEADGADTPVDSVAESVTEKTAAPTSDELSEASGVEFDMNNVQPDSDEARTKSKQNYFSATDED